MENKKNIIAVIGCMKAKKSKFLIDKYDELVNEGQTVELFSPSSNTRDGYFISSRAYPNRKIPATVVSDPLNILKSKADVLMVDEYFMFNSDYFKQFLKEVKKRNLKVFIAGLDKMANLKEFANYPILMKYTDEKIQLYADCSVDNCKEKATLTMLERLESATDFIEGEMNKYSPVCERHFQMPKTVNKF